MAQLIKALRPFRPCDIGDALVRLKYPYGGFLDGLKMFSPSMQGVGSGVSIIGPAVTVKMVEVSDTQSPKPSQHFADANEEGKVMVISQPQPETVYSACFGGLMATRAKNKGAAGVVIDGRFRDIDEVQAMGLPLFARATSILGTNTFTRASEINEPIQFKDDLWVHPGDIVVGDADGVVVVPPSLVEQVAQICRERKEMDDNVMRALQEGQTITAAWQR